MWSLIVKVAHGFEVEVVADKLDYFERLRSACSACWQILQWIAEQRTVLRRESGRVEAAASAPSTSIQLQGVM